MATLTVLYFVCVVATGVSGQGMRSGHDYQEVMANIRHAKEKYLKPANKNTVSNKMLASSRLLMDSSRTDVIARAARLLTDDPVDAPVDWRFDVSTMCINHTEMFLEALVSGEIWALQMIDAMGKPSSNLLGMHLKWVGSYDECMKVIATVNISGEITSPYKGKYCGASLKTSKPIAFLPAGTEFDVGFCVPETCSRGDTFSLVYTLAYLLGVDTDKMTPPGVYCQERHLELSTKAIAAIVVGSLFAFVLVVATAYDIIVIQWLKSKQRDSTGYKKLSEDSVYLKQNVAEHSYGAVETKLALDTSAGLDRNGVISHSRGDLEKKAGNRKKTDDAYQPTTMEQVLLSFSVYTNAAKILNTNQPPGTLTAVNGIRFISMTWVILGHTYAFGLGAGENLEEFLPNNLKRLTFQVISNATVAVDTFFALSGLLVAYLSLKEMKRRGGPLNFKWGMFYFHRFWRLTPPYMFFMLMYVPLYKYLSDGPMWQQDGVEYKECEETWWTNLLYINNIVKSKKQCMGWSWYLANDMQFYVLSPFMLIPLFYSSILGGASCLVFLLVSMISTGVISSVDDTGVATILQTAAFDKMYFKPWCRVGPYAIGFLAGYILYKSECKLKLPKVLNLAIWLVAAALAILVLYGLWDPDRISPDLSVDVSALYNATFRNVWAAAVVWVVIACATGNGGWINTLLSWKGVIPLSRLTYCAYLVHPTIMYLYYGSRRTLVYFNNIEIVYLFSGHFILSFGAAFILSLAFESPMMGLEKALLGRGKQK